MNQNAPEILRLFRGAARLRVLRALDLYLRGHFRRRLVVDLVLRERVPPAHLREFLFARERERSLRRELRLRRIDLSGPFYTSERRGGVQRRQVKLKGAEGGY